MNQGRALIAAAGLFVLGASSLAAQKTDVVVIRNGDHITGEINQLNRGILTYKTDDLGTISIEWDKVIRLTSRQYFEVETEAGDRVFGAIASGADTLSAVVSGLSIPLASIVRINPIRSRFFERLDGYLDLGFTFQQANTVLQFTIDLSVTLRTRDWLTTLQGSSYLQNQEGSASQTRNSADFQAQRMLGHHWAAIGFGALQQNEELGLDLRTQLGAGAGYAFKQTNRMRIQGLAGLAYTGERFSSDSGTRDLIEGLVGAQFEFFHPDHPTTDISISGAVFPGLTEFGRVRGQFDARVAHELIKDFTIGVTIFETFDSRPPDPTLPKNDFGVTLTLGWSF